MEGKCSPPNPRVVRMSKPVGEPSSELQNTKFSISGSVAAQSAAPAVEAPAAVDTVVQGNEQETSVPVSPLGMHGMRELLKKPFADVLTLTASNLQVPPGSNTVPNDRLTYQQ